MTKRERIADMVGYVRQHIENAGYGYDIADDSFIIKYKDGTIAYIYGHDIPDKLCLNISKISYIVKNDGDDGWDSEGKSWIRDFVKNGDFTDNSFLDDWNEYVNKMLYA